MEFRRKELDTETKKYKEEQYLITYMFGRKKTNLRSTVLSGPLVPPIVNGWKLTKALKRNSGN